MLCKCSWESGKEINVIKQIAICDKCGKEMSPYTESNSITIKWMINILQIPQQFSCVMSVIKNL